MPATLILLGVVAYLLGSIPFGLVLVRLFRHQDVRQYGSGNIGATNVVRAGGKGLGGLTFLLDAAKGFAAVMVANLIMHHRTADPTLIQNALALAAFCAVLGHLFPIWLRFRGGKGVATAFGVFLAVAPLAALISLAVFLVIGIATRYVSLASICGAAALLLADLLLFGQRQTVLLRAVVLIIPLLVIVKHHANILRLLRGTESRFGKSAKSGVAAA